MGGYGGWGQLGHGTRRSMGSAPGQMGDDLPLVDLGRNRTVRDVAAGCDYTCAVLEFGDVKCWGCQLEHWLGFSPRPNIGVLPGQMGDNLLPLRLVESPMPADLVNDPEVSHRFVSDGQL